MPIQLRQRLNCHYCGRRSKLSKKPGRRFKCEYCLADNFLDENGEIADVPLEEAAPAQRYAKPVATDPLTDEFSSQGSIFCSTCLKNQSLYTYNLSQFLPDPDHPDYDKLEADLPEFKKGLERRYPQCCAQCEPRVRAQLHQATYNARSDHLRRVLDKSRQRRVASRWGWRSLVVSAAGLGYIASLALQLIWHLYGSQITQTTFVPDFQPAQCFQRRVFLSQCLDLLDPLVPVSLAFGLLSIWWNPKWQDKLSNNDGRLLGLDRYYKVQWALLGMRLTAWIVMSHVPLSLRMKAMIHACYMVAIVIVAGWSLFGIVTVGNAPAVNWHADPAPLLLSDQFVPPKRPEQEETTQLRSQTFNVQSLSASTGTSYQAWRPPTPPEERSESMDWTPSQPTFTPELKQVRYKSTDSTPFYGTLPALNPKGVQKNPNQTQTRSKEAIGLPPGFFDKSTKSAIPARQQTSANEAMAQPKFFGHAREAETGLESFFGSVFSLQDRSLDPPPDASSSKDAPSKHFSRGNDEVAVPVHHDHAPFQTIFSGIAFVATLAALAVWIFEAAVSGQPSDIGYYIVLASTSVPLGHIVMDLCSNRTQGQVSLLLHGVEAILLFGIATLRDLFGHLFRDHWEKLAIAAVALLLPQEFLQLNRPATTPQLQIQHERPNPLASIPEEQEHEAWPHRMSIPAETPHLRRTDSDESVESRTTSTSIESDSVWETPRTRDFRFDGPSFGNPSPVRTVSKDPGKGRQAPTRSMFDLDELSSNHSPLTPRKNSFPLSGQLERMSFGPGPRPRRGF